MAAKDFDRRQFLKTSLLLGASAALGPVLSACGGGGGTKSDDSSPSNSLQGLGVIDAHAHPDMFYTTGNTTLDATSTLQTITDSGMCASSFAAIGDWVFLSTGTVGSDEAAATTTQLNRVLALETAGKVKIVRVSADIPASRASSVRPGAILTIEGGDALMGDVNRVDTFYNMGVRLLVLVHGRNNSLGDVMSPKTGRDPGPVNGGLTTFGRNAITRMRSLGMLVDLAHASRQTVRDVVDAFPTLPVIDSHTSPHYPSDPNSWLRLRPWDEMEWIAGTNGVVCTWPISYTAGGATRQTFDQWAAEIVDMKNRLGMDHVGLGSDGGGVLPAWISGYTTVGNLNLLADAMRKAGLTEANIQAYFGGNVRRVLAQTIG